MSEKNEETLARNRTILLKHATNVSNWIAVWNVGDVYKGLKGNDVPVELSSFGEFAEQTMTQVQSVFDKMKDNHPRPNTTTKL